MRDARTIPKSILKKVDELPQRYEEPRIDEDVNLREYVYQKSLKCWGSNCTCP